MSKFRPYKHQVSGIKTIHKRRLEGKGGMLLCDDMGLGKTFTMLKSIEHFYKKIDDKNKVLTMIVCPKSLLEHWYDNCCTHLLGEDKEKRKYVQIYHGTGRWIKSRTRIFITTYDTLAREYYKKDDEDKSYFYTVKWENVILDEAHIIRNTYKKSRDESKVSHKAGKSILKLDKKNGNPLTGTPWCNDDEDVHILMNFIGESKKSLRDDPMGDWMLRRTKAEYLGLPKCTESVIFTSSTDEMDHLKMKYLQLGEDANEDRFDGDLKERSKAQMQLITSALRVRQISDSPFLVPDVDSTKVGAMSIITRSPKIKKVRELVCKFIKEGRKIVIFSKFVKCLELIEIALKPIIQALVYTGKLSTDQRSDILNEFKKNNGSYVLLISIDSGGVGLNLVEASVAIIFEPWYNPFLEVQAQNRIDRIGQTRETDIIRLVDNSVKSPDVWIRGIQQSKTKKASEVVSGLSNMNVSYNTGGDMTMNQFATLFLNIEELKLKPIPDGFLLPHEDENYLTVEEKRVAKFISRK